MRSLLPGLHNISGCDLNLRFMKCISVSGECARVRCSVRGVQPRAVPTTAGKDCFIGYEWIFRVLHEESLDVVESRLRTGTRSTRRTGGHGQSQQNGASPFSVGKQQRGAGERTVALPVQRDDDAGLAVDAARER